LPRDRVEKLTESMVLRYAARDLGEEIDMEPLDAAAQAGNGVRREEVSVDARSGRGEASTGARRGPCRGAGHRRGGQRDGAHDCASQRTRGVDSAGPRAEGRRR